MMPEVCHREVFRSVRNWAAMNFAGRRIADKQAPALIKADPDRQRPARGGKAGDPSTGTPKTASCGALVPKIALPTLDAHSCAEGDTHSALQAWIGSPTG